MASAGGSAFSNAKERAKLEKTYDPRTEARDGPTLLSKMAERAKMDSDLYKQSVSAEQEELELNDIRMRRLEELRAESQGSTDEDLPYRSLKEEQFAQMLMAQHQSGQGVLVCHFPMNGSEHSKWIDEHLSRVATKRKYSNTKFVHVPEEAAARMPFINSTPAVVCFAGNEIGGVLESPARSIDMEDLNQP